MYAFQVSRPLVTNERGGLVRIVMALGEPEAAVWNTLSGDPNTPQQRDVVGRRLVPSEKDYDFGTSGYVLGADGKNTYIVHRDLEEVVSELPDDYHIGDIDIVEHQDDAIAIPGELNTFGLRRPADTLASLAVFMSDVRQIPHTPYDYQPLLPGQSR